MIGRFKLLIENNGLCESILKQNMNGVNVKHIKMTCFRFNFLAKL